MLPNEPYCKVLPSFSINFSSF